MFVFQYVIVHYLICSLKKKIQLSIIACIYSFLQQVPESALSLPSSLTSILQLQLKRSSRYCSSWWEALMKAFHSGSPKEENNATDCTENRVKANTTLPNLHREVLKWLCLFLATTQGMALCNTLSSHLLGITHMHFLLPPALELLDSINTKLSVAASLAIIIVCLSRFLINNLMNFLKN